MGKKVREYKSGDFIFAKVKGYPAWPARVQKPNGKKYFVYFYGTGETANLPPNMIFDYAENKDKFLNKSVKRKDFNDGVRQIDHDFANNVPLEQVIGALADVEPAPADDTMNDSVNDTVDDSAIADTTADETMDDTANSTAVNDGTVDDSDETGALVIDEGKKGRKSTPKTPATPKAKEGKAPRGRPRKEDAKEVEVEAKEVEEKKDEEIVSRSGRKIRPKRYMDEQTEDNATLPSPAPKKRRGASPSVEKEKPEPKEKPQDKNLKAYNTVQQSELRELKEPFKSADPERENILITYLPSGAYCGVKLFQSRPTSFKNEASRLQWDKQAASNAITLKRQLEKGQITPQSISAQLVMELNLTDEQKAMLDKDRDLEIKKSRLHFLKTEMKLIELDAKIKTCLSLEKADTELCLKLIDEILELDLAALMLLKHPTCMETVKRMRVYVGNAPSWEMSESEALTFSKQAHRIRNKADALFITMRDLFDVPEGLSFWEYFNERVAQFKAVTAELHADKLLEMVHEPIEMSQPSHHTMKAAIDAANEDDAAESEDAAQKKKATPAKGKKEKVNNTPSKTPLKRQSSRKQQQQEEKEAEKPAEEEPKEPDVNEKEETEKTDANETPKENDDTEKTNDIEKANDIDSEEADKEVEKLNDQSEKTEEKETEAEEKDKGQGDSEKVEDSPKEKESNSKEKNDEAKSKPESSKEKSEEKESEEKDKTVKDSKKSKEDKSSSSEKNSKTKEKNSKDEAKNSKDTKDAKSVKVGDKRKDKKDEKEKSEEKEKVDVDEPRAKRSRESKKTEPPPRSPAKRKSKS
ncbi:JIL-1 anchoring and stabilizing protein isoform X2 [Choristoneura fumiferana]|uniref:JIL-1 anchoring and stabilizing protein isoform X2 n=1 Tax=Choristoneura fumiferana TaxID=7141 RepID=UPI003D159EEA